MSDGRWVHQTAIYEVGNPENSAATNTMYRQVYDDPLEHTLTAVQQRAVLWRRLQRSRIGHALLQNKAQRFVALKGLRRSLHLRHELTQAKQRRAVHTVTDEHGPAPSPAPPLDPSVKALIEKLTEIAELLPSGTDLGQSFAVRTHRATGAHENDEQQTGRYDRQDHPRALLNDPGKDHTSHVGDLDRFGQSNVHGACRRGSVEDTGWTGRWADGGESRSIDEDASRIGIDGDHLATGVDIESSASKEGMLLEDEVDPDNPSMGQQLLELDTNVESFFQDLEENSKQPSTVQGSDTKADQRQHDPSHIEAERKRAERARKKERAVLLAQLGRKNMTNFRRPRWRWIADGVPDPDPNQVLKGKGFWRAAVLLVIVFFIRPKRNLLKRKARSKDRDTKDWNTTLTIYFDRCQTWLLKTSRIPITNSVLKSSKLTFRLSRMDGKLEPYGAQTQGTGKGAVTKSKTKRSFVSALLGAVDRGITHESLAITLMRLKVHAKGVLRGITQEMPPSDILAFFGYLAADGNYFPKGFFFDAEARVLSFDDLGAVRKLAVDIEPPDTLDHTLYALHPSNDLQEELEADAKRHHEGFFEMHNLKWLVPDLGKDGKGDKADEARAAARPTDLRTAVLHGRDALPGKLRPLYRHDASGRWYNTNLVEMVLTNYLMVRVLIPWILLYPRESGLVSSSGVKPSVLTHNCQVLATIVYLIIRVLRPELTPSNAETKQAAAMVENERARMKFEEDEKAAQADGKQSGSEDGGSDVDDARSGDEKPKGNETEDNKDENSISARTPVDGRTPRTTDPAASKGEDGIGDDGQAKKRKRRRLRRRRVSIPGRAQPQPRTVQQIMQQKRCISLSDKQLVQGLLADVYFLPFAEQLRPWVLELAAEFDAWMQKVVVIVMNKVETSMSAIRQEKANKESVDDR